MPLLLALAFLAAGTAAASAQEEQQRAPDGSIIRRTGLERTCLADLARFCPDLADTPGQTRNEVICLKPYRTSLSTFCRAAVNKAMK